MSSYVRVSISNMELICAGTFFVANCGVVTNVHGPSAHGPFTGDDFVPDMDEGRNSSTDTARMRNSQNKTVVVLGIANAVTRLSQAR